MVRVELNEKMILEKSLERECFVLGGGNNRDKGLLSVISQRALVSLRHLEQSKSKEEE